MSRNMSASNSSIFSALDLYCANRGDPVRNAGTKRWISGPTGAEKSFLADAKVVFALNFTLTRRVGLFEHEGKSFFCLVGFDGAASFADLVEVPVTGGIFTAVIAELVPKPIAPTSSIRNVVEAQDYSSAGAAYKGHQLALMETLFPRVKVFSFSKIAENEAYRAFFRFCAMECDNGDFWIENRLAAALIELCDLDSISVPFQTLCRSIFDADPAGLFLGLYRCLEALYALNSARKVAKDFNLSTDWTVISIALESTLGWRAPEAASLNQLLGHCEEETFKAVFSALHLETTAVMPGLIDAAGRQIYKLRNSLVHYRPIHHRTEYKNVDWNELCIVMTVIVKSVYGKIFVTEEEVEEATS